VASLRSKVVHGWELAIQILKRIAFEVGPARGRVGRDGEPTRAAMIAALLPYRNKVIRVCRTEDLERFLAGLVA
jgi:hypothetical protein